MHLILSHLSKVERKRKGYYELPTNIIGRHSVLLPHVLRKHQLFDIHHINILKMIPKPPLVSTHQRHMTEKMGVNKEGKREKTLIILFVARVTKS